MAMKALLSEEEWRRMENGEKRILLGLHPENDNYVMFFLDYFGHSLDLTTESYYPYYRKWWMNENSPLGKALK